MIAFATTVQTDLQYSTIAFEFAFEFTVIAFESHREDSGSGLGQAVPRVSSLFISNEISLINAIEK